MEATQRRPALDGLRRNLGTRRGAVIAAAGAALLAGVILLVFVTSYRKSVKSDQANTPVLVADRLIPAGTTGDIVISDRFFRPSQVTREAAKAGAVTDASVFAGKVATRDIYPGQQISAADFARDADPLRGKLTGVERAIAIPLDGAHGLVGHVRVGDRVDVLGGFNAQAGNGTGRPELRTLVQDVLVLNVPSVPSTGLGSGSNSTNNIVVRVSDRQAAQVAFAADNGKIWFILRPPAGAKDSRVSDVTLESVLVGTNPVNTRSGG